MAAIGVTHDGSVIGIVQAADTLMVESSKLMDEAHAVERRYSNLKRLDEIESNIKVRLMAFHALMDDLQIMVDSMRSACDELSCISDELFDEMRKESR